MMRTWMKRMMVFLVFLLLATPAYARHAPAHARASHGQMVRYDKKLRHNVKKKACGKKACGKKAKKGQRRAATRGKHRLASGRSRMG